MDSDISHEVEKRLTSIEERLDKLDGGPPEEVEEEETTVEGETNE